MTWSFAAAKRDSNCTSSWIPLSAFPYAWQMIDGERTSVDCSLSLQGESGFGFALSGSYDENLPLVIDPLIPYATYLGGLGASASTTAQGIAVDGQGYAYVTGYTESADFPVTSGTFQTIIPSIPSTFIAVFAEDGESLFASTYLGGSEQSISTGIDVDSRIPQLSTDLQ